MKKLLSTLLVLILCFVFISNCISVSAISLNEEIIVDLDDQESNTNAVFFPIYKDDDTFGYWGWDSLGAAMSCYGMNFTYKSCSPFNYSGHTYNYYYTFSDGSKMFFGVVAK